MSLLAALCSSRKRLIADTTPLRTPDFRRLWLSGVVTVIGANLTIFAVPVQIYALTQSSAYVGLTGVFAVVPLVVFGLWGGAWADAMDRRVLLIIASCGLAVASVLLWVQAALALNNVWLVLRQRPDALGRRRRPTTIAAGCRGCSSSSSPVARCWPTPRTAPPLPSSAPRSRPPGEGRSWSSES